MGKDQNNSFYKKNGKKTFDNSKNHAKRNAFGNDRFDGDNDEDRKSVV